MPQNSNFEATTISMAHAEVTREYTVVEYVYCQLYIRVNWVKPGSKRFSNVLSSGVQSGVKDDDEL